MARPRSNLAGSAFGHWRVLREAATKSRAWLCQCSCGVVRPVLQVNLVTGRSRSCGCGGSTLRPLGFTGKTTSAFEKARNQLKEKKK